MHIFFLGKLRHHPAWIHGERVSGIEKADEEVVELHGK
jgi:hypothetical protein